VKAIRPAKPGERITSAINGSVITWVAIDVSDLESRTGDSWAVVSDPDLTGLTAVALIRWSEKAGQWFAPAMQQIEWNRLQSITWLQFRDRIGAA
jgi:hypothetical protein